MGHCQKVSFLRILNLRRLKKSILNENDSTRGNNSINHIALLLVHFPKEEGIMPRDHNHLQNGKRSLTLLPL